LRASSSPSYRVETGSGPVPRETAGGPGRHCGQGRVGEGRLHPGHYHQGVVDPAQQLAVGLEALREGQQVRPLLGRPLRLHQEGLGQQVLHHLLVGVPSSTAAR